MVTDSIIEIELPDQPLSPWLRLAHITTIGHDAAGRGILRTIDDYMLMLQLDGTSYVWWEELGGSVAVPAGAVAFIPPGREHAWGVCPGAHLAVHFDLHANPLLQGLDMLHHRDRWVEAAPLAVRPVVQLLRRGQQAGLRIPLVVPLRRPGQLREQLQVLVQMYASRSHDELRSRMLAAEILLWTVQLLGQDQPASGGAKADPRMLALLADLDAGHAQAWSVTSLCRRVGMGRTAFLKAFRRAAGDSPRRHLESLRMERAAHLLVDTDQPILEIARTVGFLDPYHFSRVFQRRNGCSPRQYRRRSRNVSA